MKIDFPYNMEYCYNGNGTVTFNQRTSGRNYVYADVLDAYQVRKSTMESVFLYCDRSAKYGIPVYACQQKFNHTPWQVELKHPLIEGRIQLKTKADIKEIVFEYDNKVIPITKSNFNFYVRSKSFRDHANEWFKYCYVSKDKNDFLKDALEKRYTVGDYIYFATNQCFYFGDVMSFTETIDHEINGCIINVQKTDNKNINNILKSGQQAQYIICGMKSSANYMAPSKKKTGTIISFDESEAVKRLLRC